MNPLNRSCDFVPRSTSCSPRRCVHQICVKRNETCPNNATDCDMFMDARGECCVPHKCSARCQEPGRYCHWGQCLKACRNHKECPSCQQCVDIPDREGVKVCEEVFHDFTFE